MSISNIITAHLGIPATLPPDPSMFSFVLVDLASRPSHMLRMLRYSIHAFAALVVWFALTVMPAIAAPCAASSGIAQASHELRAMPQAALLHHHHERGD